MDEADKKTKRYGADDAASLALAGSIAALATRLEEVVTIQSKLAEELAEHSRKSTAAQTMLLGEIERAKSEHLLRTGDQSKAIEILKIERESIDNELRKEVDRARQDLEYYKGQQPALLKRLEKISDRLERGGKEIDKGVRAWEILKWAGITVGALLLMAAVAKLFLGNGPIHVGESRPGTIGADAISYMMAKMGAAWLAISGLVAAAMDFRMKHIGS